MLRSLGDFNLPEHIRLAWGKLRRLWYAHCNKEYIAANLARRRGECHRCGACCKLMFQCPLLRENGTHTECTAHVDRAANCRVFPIDEADLRDRDLVMPHTPCGFYFVRDGN